jgi:hypothetical protein
MVGKLVRDPEVQGDNRSTQRHACVVQTTCQPPSAWSKDPWPATIRDLFQARFGQGEILRWYVKRLDLAGGWPLADGKQVSFRVGGLPPDTPPVEMVIKKCRLIGSYWIVDCKFRTPLSDAFLQALTTPSDSTFV